MKRAKELILLGALAIALELIVVTVLVTAHTALFDLQGYAMTRHTYAAEQKRTLPKICKRYYGDGTNRWKSCMGVGLK